MKRFKMHCRLYISLFILMSTTLTHAIEAVENSQAQEVYDLFSGTIGENQGQLVLNHCTLAKYSYPMHFNHPEDEKRIRSLLRQDPYFWLNLSARAYSENEKFHLMVDGITEIHIQASCHLSDLLSNSAKL
ncbi:hypothetical protein H0917_12225 [Acinetobacter sp. C_3_1]|nr:MULTISPECIES: hypothetical protein [unclassified Acinetobacter]MCT8098838.1 hypothetical protein [Acinetobacter sp. C_3_1]